MRHLQSYVGLTVFSAIVMVLLVILGLDALSAVIDNLQDMKGDFGFSEVLFYVLLTLPRKLTEYLPFAALVGCLAGLGSMANNSELVVMRAAGLSTGRLVWLVMRPTFVLIFAGMLITEYVAPPAEQYAETRKTIKQHGNQTFNLERGLWNRDGNEFMHFNVVQSGGVINGLKVFSFDQNRKLEQVMTARRATYQEEGFWVVEKARIDSVTDAKISRQKFPSYRWNSGLTPRMLEIVAINPDQLSITALWRAAQYRLEQGLDANSFMLEFWRKILTPLGTASLVLIGISFIFGPLREVTMGYRIFTGVIVGIVFRTTQDLLGPASLVFNFQPIYSVIVPIGICLAVGIVLLRRA
ncbi:Lipopolysaccharide export system permease protein LptG [Sinobacterium norvegicum]|uniref:Lipopolysaccharide export system permease protein LptG n=1 Tax=Sinobacterium norvegicum TaxID=1641715 RepID=A0ABM9AC84_9GAMM|nr:LPS export ABC transporter permease LptG [Sinobacterium norvegicum]CAH0990812.1 Lipopolysaccharide export system permease protein LptG [Sinobacterium norvegicum]